MTFEVIWSIQSCLSITGDGYWVAEVGGFAVEDVDIEKGFYVGELFTEFGFFLVNSVSSFISDDAGGF